MKITLEISNEHNYTIPQALDAFVNSVMALLDYKEDAILSVAFLDDGEISKLYEEYFGYAQPTDVLSFPSNAIDPETGQLFLGDILFDYPFIQNQAKVLENEFEAELSLLTIHGILHLLGYDHDNEEEKSKMWKLQNEILAKSNIKINKIPE
jgi:probable rRNA maturation factor